MRNITEKMMMNLNKAYRHSALRRIEIKQDGQLTRLESLQVRCTYRHYSTYELYVILFT